MQFPSITTGYLVQRYLFEVGFSLPVYVFAEGSSQRKAKQSVTSISVHLSKSFVTTNGDTAFLRLITGKVSY